MEIPQPDQASSNGFVQSGNKRNRVEVYDGICPYEAKRMKGSSNVIDYSDPFAGSNMISALEVGKYGSRTKELEEIDDMWLEKMKQCILLRPSLAYTIFAEDKSQNMDVINLDEDDDDDDAEDFKKALCVVSPPTEIVIIVSDDEDNETQLPTYQFQSSLVQFQKSQDDVIPVTPPQSNFEEVVLGRDYQEDVVPVTPRFNLEEVVSSGRDMEMPSASKAILTQEEPTRKDKILSLENSPVNDKGVYVGVEDSDSDSESEAEEDLGNIWNEMALAIECSKDAGQTSHKEPKEALVEDCDHSFILMDDMGYVCRVCGVVEKSILNIIDVQFNKAKRNTRTYASETKNKRVGKSDAEIQFFEEGLMIGGLSAHPMHANQMKPHQIEGFQFLCSNLVADEPGGCIMAHAPGSGKTFMIISFMQSFLAKYPQAKPLIVLPKGILSTWKREFLRWQVEDIPMFDFYSVKAENRAHQLAILKQWMEKKSILFLGYKQFSTIVCDDTSTESRSCQEILLKVPSILILDEGHTPRNEDTNVLQSLARVQTPRKVVLSGTLYQNHVKEVFNILNLVRPKFLKLDTSKSVVKRILSRAPSNLRYRPGGSSDRGSAFNDVVEHTLQKCEDFRVKIAVIQDLRKMTKKVLHYYKGDFLDELPGLDDFTVVLNLFPRQLNEVKKLKQEKSKFKVSAEGSAIYLHPKLKEISKKPDEKPEVIEAAIEAMLEKVDVNDGVKGKFFLNLINLCDSAGEKLLVFSQYLVPLKFLVRLAYVAKGWKLGKEVFLLTGDNTSEQRELSMERFNNSPDAKIFFGSIKACGEGISLVGASRILILDVPLNPSVTRQAIGRAFRPGQTKKVHAYRLIAGSSPEEDDHKTCFKKEVISKMWFEWNEFCGYRNFEVETIDVDKAGDSFLESPALREDIRVLYKR